MSLESALEEERLKVMELLEAREKEEQRQAAAKKNSLVIDEKDKLPRPRSKSEGTKHGRPSSLLLDPSDPYSSGDSFYYAAGKLKPPSPGLSADIDKMTLRPHMPGRSSSSSRLEESFKPHEEPKKAPNLEGLPSFDKAYKSLKGLYGEEHFTDEDNEPNKRLQKDEELDSSSDEEEEEEEEEEEDDDNIIKPHLEGLETHKEELERPSLHSLIIDDAVEAKRKKLGEKPVPKSESPTQVQRLKVKSLIELANEGTITKGPTAAEYAAYKRRIIHPMTAFDAVGDIPEDTPYTSDTEELLDARRAAQLEMHISQIYSNVTAKRMVRTMRRGDLKPLGGEIAEEGKTRTYIVATDLSPEAQHALEWTIGTVLRDGNILYSICALEDTGSEVSSVMEEERLKAMEKLTNSTVKLLKKTRLQVHVVVEVIHCKTPKHMITEIIDHVAPTLVILGSRGRGALKGVLLGSFSNYVVERSSVPVMVARRKLQKAKNRGLNVRLANNLRAGQLAAARVD
ncbi:hypothetical protein TRVA0_001S01222 [Trichomonascus vanleenenianus]|uniref:universal stress protein n=1 Tax=Trichomonascus vanleenenianus TaxID=2268995 RepID=UPI003ECA909D